MSAQTRGRHANTGRAIPQLLRGIRESYLYFEKIPICPDRASIKEAIRMRSNIGEFRRVTILVPLAVCVALASFGITAQAAGPRGASESSSAAPKSTEPKKEKEKTKAKAGNSASGGSTSGGSKPSESASGRLVLVIVDQNGAALTSANVDVSATSSVSGSYRDRASSDSQGRATFTRVPGRVNLSVTATNGSFSQNVDVAQVGDTEVRVVVDLFESNESGGAAAGAGGGGGAPAGGGQRGGGGGGGQRGGF